ncbi:Transporter mch4 [Fusarium falciforme]|uniref:Transporter mch4 n=1 Tax=Fusarium falciforme TaxID=195108 RepID=UPI0023018950|nr:Transporter mch4 [Fusarium falciforme]WAO91276.1 Transporter mch4 [Fusarium falciforme]
MSTPAQHEPLATFELPEGPHGSSDPTHLPSDSMGIAEAEMENIKTESSPYLTAEAPDGGTAAWLVVLGAWCTSFCSFGWLNSVGVFQEYYQNVLLSTYSSSEIAWIPSLQIFFMMAMGPVVGTLFDRYGPRWLLFIGSLLHVLGVMMTSLGSQYYQVLLAQGVCSDIGVACIFQPAMNVIGGWFDKKRGAAFGILSTGSSLGGVVFPIMVNRLICRAGFGWAMRARGFLVLFMLTIANLTIRAYRPPHPQKVTGAMVRKPFTEPEFVLLSADLFCFTYVLFVPINYITILGLHAGMETNLAEYLAPMLNGGSLFGRLLIPTITNASLIAFAVLFGFSSGAYVSLITPLVMQISPPNEIGLRTGIIFFVNAVAGLTTNPINGAILAKPNGWIGMKPFAGIFCLVGTTFVLAARVYKTGWKLNAIF